MAGSVMSSKKRGKMKKYKSGGQIDGIAQKGHTRGQQFAHGGAVKLDSTSNAGKKSNPTQHFQGGGPVNQKPKKATPRKMKGAGAATRGDKFHSYD